MLSTYPDKTLEIWKNAIQPIVDSANTRKEYGKIAIAIAQPSIFGFKKESINTLNELKQLFPNKTALKEEVDKVIDKINNDTQLPYFTFGSYGY